MENKELKNNKKISLVTYIIILMIMATLVGGLIFYNIKSSKQIEDKNSINETNNIEHNTSNINENKLIENTKYVEIAVEDEETEEANYKSLIKIEDSNIINNLEEMINLCKEYKFNSAFELDIPPYAIFHLENGDEILVVAINNLEMEGEESGNYIIVTINGDEANKKTYKVQDKVATYFTKLYSENKNNISDENYIILYNGYEIEKKTGTQYENYMKITNNNKIKYSITYYNYEKGQAYGITKGEFGNINIYDGYSHVENVKKIAISKKYNAIPRTSTKLKKLPKDLEDMLDYSKVDIESVDLDGDGKLEYIASAQKYSKTGDYEGVTSNEAYSEIILFDFNFKKVATLASWDNKGIKENSKEQYLQLEDVIYVDIDNDNNMEILVDLPTYDSSILSIYRYSNNKINGETNYKVSVEP